MYQHAVRPAALAWIWLAASKPASLVHLPVLSLSLLFTLQSAIWFMNRSWFDAAGLIGKLAGEAMERIPYFIIAAVVFVLFVLLGKMLRRIIRIVTGKSLKRRNLGIVLGRLAFGFAVLLGLLIALVIVIPGFTPGQLVNLLGLSSVAIGFAFRDILQNFLAGILLLLTHPFRIGDQIVVGTFEGTVEEIETRATFLRTYDGRRIVIPNSKLFTESVTVNTANDARRMQYDIGIGNSDDIATAKRIMLETVRAIPDVLDDPPADAIVIELADSAVNIRLRWWVHPPRQMELLTVQDQVLERVKHALTAEGIDLPYPTRQILFHDQTEETDGDRSRQREGWPKGRKEIPVSARITDGLKALGPLMGKEEAERERGGADGSPNRRAASHDKRRSGVSPQGFAVKRLFLVDRAVVRTSLRGTRRRADR